MVNKKKGGAKKPPPAPPRALVWWTAVLAVATTVWGIAAVGLEAEDVNLARKDAVVDDYLNPMVLGCFQYDSSPNLIKYQTGFIIGIADNKGQPDISVDFWLQPTRGI